MTATIEDVAGCLREAAKQQTIIARAYHKLGWSEHSHDAETLGEYFADRAAQVEALGLLKTCDTCLWRECAIGNNLQIESWADWCNNRLLDIAQEGPNLGCIYHEPVNQPPTKK